MGVVWLQIRTLSIMVDCRVLVDLNTVNTSTSNRHGDTWDKSSKLVGEEKNTETPQI